MNLTEMKRSYAKVIVGAGVDVKPNQTVHMFCPVEACDFARLVAEEAFALGAKDVFVEYTDTAFNRIKYTHASDETLANPPSYLYDTRKYFIDQGSALIVMNYVNPNTYAGINPRKVGMANGAVNALIGPANKFMFPNKCTFTSICIPDQIWADTVFPNTEDSLIKLWETVCIACRTDKPDPVGSWRNHLANIRTKGAQIKEYKFTSLRFINSLGTDLTMQLPEKHIWTGGGIAWDDKVFFPNLPTEEIFSAPIRTSLNGKVVASMPLVHAGQLINDFYFVFENGKVVEYGAKQGQETLKTILETDECAKYVGEVALVQYDSPISRLNTLFYTTLFDENASCHLALGNAYANCIEGSRGQTPEWLMENGLNVSKVHVDFMIGTSDLSIVGTTADGEQVAVFDKGNWAI